MAYEDGKRAQCRPHSACLDNREKLKLTGVTDVGGFDENTVVLATDMGNLTVRGRDLHVERMDLTTGELEVHGRIQEISYEEPKARSGLFERLFS